MMADVSWCRSRTGIGYLQKFCFQSLMESSRGECERKIGAVHKVRHAIFGQFLPPPLSHFVTHPGTPRKYVTHLGPPPIFRRPSTKNLDKSPLVQIMSQLFAGLFVRGVLSGVFCLEGFVWGGFCPFPFCQNTSVTPES